MDFFDNTDNFTGLHSDKCGCRQLDFGTCDGRGPGGRGFPEAVCPVCCPYGWGYRQNFVWEGTGYYPAHGQYHENYDLYPGSGERKGEDTVKASSNAASQPKVHLGVREGEEYRLEDLLYALMLESYNDAAVMIAEHIGGSVEGFAAMMNEKAVGLGCGDTYFITPNGLDGVRTDEQGKEHIHSTTASDLARIMRYCVTKSPARDEFLKITQTQNHYFTDTAGKRSFNCYNHNAFLTMMEGVLSGKTGFTGGAGYSYVGAMENQGRTYVIALLGCGWPPHKTYKWSDARKLYSYGLEHFKMKDVFREEAFARVPVAGGLCWKEGEGATDQVELSMMLKPDDMHLTLLMGEGEQARVVKKVPSILMAPVREGQQVGTVDYYLGEVLVKRFPVYAVQGVEKMNLRRAADRVLDLFLVR